MNHPFPAILLMAAVAYAAPSTSAAAGPAPADAKNQLESLYEAEWQRWLREDPTLATSVGDPRYNDRWPDLSLAALEKTREADGAALAALMRIDIAGLP